ncbi:MAG: hypothetical protein ABI947_06570 [Chloroflexota bacterium]
MLNDTTSPNESIIACNLNAISADQRELHEVLSHSLFAAVQEIQTLPNGYAFRLPSTSAMILKAAEYVANERLCCPFFNFTLEIEPNERSFWLRLTGDEGVKVFIKAEFPAILDPGIVATAGL